MDTSLLFCLLGDVGPLITLDFIHTNAHSLEIQTATFSPNIVSTLESISSGLKSFLMMKTKSFRLLSE